LFSFWFSIFFLGLKLAFNFFKYSDSFLIGSSVIKIDEPIKNESEYLKKLNASFKPKKKIENQKENKINIQEISEPAPETQIKQIKIGPHPKYTRLLVDIAGPAQYQVSANFNEKKIALIFEDAAADLKVKPRKYRDKNLSAIGVQSIEGQVILTLHLRKSNTICV
jgi:hypothetical protein